jgi:cytochrome c2
MKQFIHTLRRITTVILPVLFVMLSTGLSAQGDAVAGKGIFTAKCASCHNMTKDVTGPALMGVLDGTRAPSKEWLKLWIKDNVALRNTGDAYANKIYEAWGGANMTSFSYFSEKELDDVIEYVATYEIPVGGPKELLPCIPKTKKEEESNIFLLLSIIGIALFIIVIFTGVNKSLKNAAAQKKGETPAEPLTFWEAIGDFAGRKKIQFGLIVLFIVGGLASAGWDSLLGIGIFGGNGFGDIEVVNYKPTQPIEFRHDIHAKQNEIDCKYCHSGTIEGKHALIPSANVCMNCHSVVKDKEDCDVSATEIQKIYDAVNFDSKKGAYFKVVDGKKEVDAGGKVIFYDEQVGEGNPIEWVKVHNLQDFVYFNHSQHVVVGNVDCKECHGDMESMTTAEQHAPLTMGWCIECHRTKEINETMKFSGKPNGYYEKMHDEFKEAYKHQEKFDFTVEKIGGLECAKCHY